MLRAHWGSRVGFVLAAAGSAVGLGNLWKFPYIAGVHGGGAFVLVYLVCIACVGLPVMIGEIMIGRLSEKSPVGAYRALSGGAGRWAAFGWLGVLGAFVLLSFYAVVAGWALHYAWLATRGEIAGRDPAEFGTLFGAVSGSSELNLLWTLVFLGVTAAVVLGGVRGGIERCSRVLMPLLLLMLLALLWHAARTEGFAPALDFVFGAHADRLTASGVLEALGHAFFTLSLGMGGMITYGSYLERGQGIVSSSFAITALDTLVALLACMVLFPIIFSYGMEPSEGPGLVFVSIPIALSQMPAGGLLAVIFFGLLVFAALTSAIALLEVATSYFIDERGWSRRRAVLLCAGAIGLLALPSALSRSTELFGADVEALVGRNWFDLCDWLVSNWALPIGGLGTALFCGWRLEDLARREAFVRERPFVRFYRVWLGLVRWVVPAVIVSVGLHRLGLF